MRSLYACPTKMMRSTRFSLSLAIALASLAVAGVAHAEGAARHTTDIRVADDAGGGAIVTATFSSEPAYNARLEQKGRRLIIDVPGTDIRGAAGAIVKKTGVVGGVMTQVFDVGGNKTTRILITLLEESKYSVKVEGKRLIATFRPGPAGTIDERSAPKRLTGDATPAPKGDYARVSDVRFEHTTLEDRVVIELSESAKFHQSAG